VLLPSQESTAHGEASVRGNLPRKLSLVVHRLDDGNDWE
jgi:hypothetical protein